MLDLLRKTCCFTGHRALPPKETENIKRRLKEVLTLCVERGYRYFKTGGALGFDTIAAQAVLELKARNAKVELELLLPYAGQARAWSGLDAAEYERIKSEADRVDYISEEYRRGCIQERNRRLVDGCGLCICYLTGGGGTAYTVRYAESRGVEILNIAETESIKAYIRA